MSYSQKEQFKELKQYFEYQIKWTEENKNRYTNLESTIYVPRIMAHDFKGMYHILGCEMYRIISKDWKEWNILEGLCNELSYNLTDMFVSNQIDISNYSLKEEA